MRIVKHVLCVCAAALFLAGCGASQSGDSSSESAPAASAPPAVDSGPGGKRAAAGPEVAAGSAARGNTTTAGKLNVPVPAARSVVYTANLRVRAKNVDNAATTAKQLVAAAGGYVESESGSSRPVSSHLTFKVPSDKYATVLGQLTGQLGTKLSLQQQAEDVTEQVADVDSRVKSAQATLQTFRKLLNRANTVGEVLNVEQEISQREADLESLQARQKSLALQTRYGTVTLQLEAPAARPAAADDDDEGGFLGGLKSGWEAFVAVVWGAATVLGWLLPFLVVAAVVGLPAWWLLRRRRRPAVSPLPPAPPAA